MRTRAGFVLGEPPELQLGTSMLRAALERLRIGSFPLLGAGDVAPRNQVPLNPKGIGIDAVECFTDHPLREDAPVPVVHQVAG